MIHGTSTGDNSVEQIKILKIVYLFELSQKIQKSHSEYLKSQRIKDDQFYETTELPITFDRGSFSKLG